MKPGTLVAMSLIFFSLLSAVVKGQQIPVPFTEDSMADIESVNAGRPFILLLWSKHCAPCFQELKMLGKLLEHNSTLPVVLVSTDPPEEASEVHLLLADYNLQQLPVWQFAEDFPEKLRYRIDPGWFGELPRSYFYDAAGNRNAHSGVLTHDELVQWLK